MRLFIGVLAVAAVTVATTPACVRPLYYDSSYTPVATGDGGGEAIVLYAKSGKGGLREFYVQRIDAAGKRLWGEDALLGAGYREPPRFRDLWIAAMVRAKHSWLGPCSPPNRSPLSIASRG